MEQQCDRPLSEGSLLPSGAGSNRSLAQLLAQRQWWKVCWVYGDQQKYYRQLYGRKKNLSTLRATATTTAVAKAEEAAADASDDDDDDGGDAGSPSPLTAASDSYLHTSSE